MVSLLPLCVGAGTLRVEVADDPYERSLGLMYRRELPEDRGMLFVFPYPQRLSFWMKNTYVPLSIAYIGSDWVIREIYDLEPLNERPVVSKYAVQYALEVNRGWFKRHGVKVGDTVRFPCR